MSNREKDSIFYGEENFRNGPFLENCLIREANEERAFIKFGSVRGVLNGVKKIIGQLQIQCQWTKNYEHEEKGKVVVYVTSLGVIRKTWERCRFAVATLENHLIEFERRDLGLNRNLKEEFQNRIGNDHVAADLPSIFVDGKYFGGADQLERWSESGLLKRLLEPYKRKTGSWSLCTKCYGFGYFPCSACGGSKKSSIMSLKCTRCDYGGLVPCNECRE